ncbi:hypothetical protein GN316_12680 [Xylophilus sp. Kf1]|nr:hypothetical protein [Xylophilus sp. Kf1]
MPPMDFNLVDLLLAFFFVLALFRGWRAGFLVGAVRIGSVAAALAAAWVGTPYLAGTVDRLGWLPEPWASPAAFVLILLLVLVPVSGLLYRAIGGGVQGRAARATDQFFGLLPGAVSGGVTVMVIVALLTTLPLQRDLSQTAHDSRAVQALAEPIDWVDAQLEPIFNPALQQASRLVTPLVEPTGTSAPGHGAITLPFTVQNAGARPELEAAMLVLVNAERERVGSRPLAADPDTVHVARAHGRDMFARGYFAHETPEGASPFDRLRTAGIRYRTAGENLALSPTLKSAHEGLMKSPGHRENILNPAFGRLGIGIVDGGRKGLIVTQLFRN